MVELVFLWWISDLACLLAENCESKEPLVHSPLMSLQSGSECGIKVRENHDAEQEQKGQCAGHMCAAVPKTTKEAT